VKGNPLSPGVTNQKGGNKMGIDLIAINPKAKEGRCFGHNWFCWERLWDLVQTNCQDFLTKEDIRQGSWNNEYPIAKEKAEKIAERLKIVLSHIELLPSQEPYCCHVDYPREDFSNADMINLLKSFIGFCENCGGFIIA